MKTSLLVILAFAAGSLYAVDPLIVFFIDPSCAEYSGDAMLVCTPGGRNFIIDAGMYSGYNPLWDCGEERVLPLLDSLGITYLDGAVGTHPHADHIGGMISVYESLPVVTAYDSGWPYAAGWTYETYLQAIWNNGSDFVTPRRGDYLNWGPELTVEVIHPVDPLSPSNANNASIVIRLTYEDVSFLFTGDLETNGGEDVILAALSTGDIEDISANVLKVGHHGSHTSTCARWLSAVNPSIAAICLGAGNPYGHPHAEVLNRLEAGGITVYRNDLDGTFYLSSDGEGVYFNTMPPEGPESINEFAVYPSPATTQATFTWNSSDSRQCCITVFNLNGEKVLDAQAAGGVFIWNLSTGSGVVSPGLYAAVFRTSGGVVFTEYFTVSR
ncbi:MAG: MBL fold metallo-hydrolase [Candidatus Aegiribacteria sp.]|nr:MBL fold metallo-hydrolase [Candidatus Aegiribacteria sp.]